MSASHSNVWLPVSWLDVLGIPLRAYVMLLLLSKHPSPALKGSLPPEMGHGSDVLLPNKCSSVQVLYLIYACAETKRQITSDGDSIILLMPNVTHCSACLDNCSKVQMTFIPANCMSSDFHPVIIVQAEFVCKDLQGVFETITLLLAQEQRRQEQTHFDQRFKLPELLILQYEQYVLRGSLLILQLSDIT